MTPLFRELVAMPSLGFCSTRKTSPHRAETARAIAQPTTPPPMMSMLAWSMIPFYPRVLSMRINFVEVGFAFDKARLRPVVNRINRMPFFFVMILPKRSSSMLAVFIQRVKENVKGRKFLLVAVVVVRDARERLKACILGRLSAPHHFHNRVPARDLDVLLAFSGRARGSHFVVHKAARANNGRIAHASWNLPRQSTRGGRRGDVSFFVHGHAGYRPRRRMRNRALGISDLFLVVAEDGRHLLFPFRAVNSRPPVDRRRSLPPQPDLPRMFGEQVHLLKTLRHAEPPCPVTNNHHVIGLFHDRLRQPRDILDPPHTRDSPCSPRRAMHAARVQLHFAFFIRQAAVSDGIVVRIILHDGYGSDDCVQRVAALLEDVHPLIQRVKTVRAGNDHRSHALRRRKSNARRLRRKRRAKSLPALAMRLLARDVRKNLRRDQTCMKKPPERAGEIYRW